MKPLKESPAGELDYYSAMDRARRAKEVEQDENSEYCRPVKHVSQVMIDMIKILQDAKTNEDIDKKMGAWK